jgi:alanyl-tRNA synthetase
VPKVDITDNIPRKLKNDILNLSKTIPIYYEDPYLQNFNATILKHVNLEDVCYIVLDRTVFFPEGGGQLGDIGYLEGSFGKLNIIDTQAIDDIIIHIAVKNNTIITEGEPVFGKINWNIRYERMKHHTASHLIFSAIKKVLHLENLMYMGIQIKEDASRIDINYSKSIQWDEIMKIERLSNNVCFENRKVKIWYTNRDEAERTYGKRLGITQITPSGIVRIIEVDDWDVALCSGTHVKSTAEIGLISIIDRLKLTKGVERIEFTAGKHAYLRYNEAIKRLTELAQILKTSTTDVQIRVNNLLRERKELKKELNKIKEQLVEFHVFKLHNQSKPLGEFKILKEKLIDVDAQSLKRISSKLIEKDPFLIVILGSNIGNTVFLAGAAGINAVRKGIDMAEIIKKPAMIIKGSGGGNQRLAQAGGRIPDKLEESLCLFTREVSLKVNEFEKINTTNNV